MEPIRTKKKRIRSSKGKSVYFTTVNFSFALRPLYVFAVIVVLPRRRAVTLPVCETFATPGREEWNFSLRLADPEESFTFKVKRFPFFMVFFFLEGLNFILDGAFLILKRYKQVSVLSETRMDVFPRFSVDTLPVLLTEARAGSLLVKPVYLFGSRYVSPFPNVMVF